MLRYFDYAATAPLCEEAASAMAPYMTWGVENLEYNANANSLHTPGRAAFASMEAARKVIVRCVGARRPDEIIFTSGATESDDAALMGLVSAAEAMRKKSGKPVEKPRIIVSQLEHSAVLQPAKRLEQAGYDVVRLAPDSCGFISVEKLREALNDQTLLVSVHLANSEVGSIQPIKEMAQLSHAAGALMHTDATQALGKIPVDVQGLEVDAASFSAHKIGGPKGIGALYLRARTPFDAFMLGGGQEAGKRSGTQNVCGMAGFAAAAQAAVDNLSAEMERLSSLREKLYRLFEDMPSVRVTVPALERPHDYLPNLVHVMVKGIESETLIIRFDSLGIAVSGGSACSSHSLEPSRVLASMGIQADWARGALRLSMGRYTTADDVDALMGAVPEVLKWK